MNAFAKYLTAALLPRAIGITSQRQGNDFEFINTINEEWSGALPFTVIYDIGGNATVYWENMQDKKFFERQIKAALTS